MARDPRPLLVDALVPIQQRALRDHVPHAGTQPPDLACLFAWVDRDGCSRLFSVPRTGSDHQLHDGYAAVGTGAVFAEYALAPVACRELSLEQAQVVAARTVADAIEVAAFYLGPPVQIVSVTAAGVRGVEVDGALLRRVEAWKAWSLAALGGASCGASPLGPSPRSGTTH